MRSGRPQREHSLDTPRGAESGGGAARAPTPGPDRSGITTRGDAMPTVTTRDGAEIFYKDWGAGGTPVVLSHGWPLNADAWDAAARFLAEHGHRTVTHDRRGHGRSSQTWYGHE